MRTHAFTSTAGIAANTNPAYTRELLDRHGDIELEFVQHLATRTVHVVVPADPDPYVDDAPVSELSDEGKFQAFLNCWRRAAPTLCGYNTRVWLGGGGDHDIVDTFPDAALCARCHRALGSHAHRAFEHPQP